MNQLQHERDEIEKIDRQMAALFEQRMRQAGVIAAYKKEHGLPVLDAGREQALLEKNRAYVGNAAYLPYYEDFFKNLLGVSKQYQKNLLQHEVIGYQGVEGAYSHIALRKCFGPVDAMALSTFEEVFQAVQAGTVTAGVLPFENSYTGEVGEVLDLLMQYDCHIGGMYDLRIDQNLLGLPGAGLDQIRRVYSHPQAISQCSAFLESRHLEAVPYPNTALAAKFVSEQNDPALAAIASEETASLYGLEVLAEAVNTSRQNTTRFIFLRRQRQEEGNRFSLLFTVRHDVGMLARVMSMIGDEGFNLESIKSRPLHQGSWEYYFYAEIVGNLADEKTGRLLSKLRGSCDRLKVLGGYTAGVRD